MAEFITLTHFESSQPLRVNVDAILFYMRAAGAETTTEIRLVGCDPIRVVEEPERITELLRKPISFRTPGNR